MAARRDRALGPDRGRALEDDLGMDRRVGADRDRVVDVRARGVDDGDAGGHQAVEVATAQDRRVGRELLPVGYPEGLGWVPGHHGFDPDARLGYAGDGGRQVVLALVV